MIPAYNLGALFDPELGGDNLALIDCLDWDAPRHYSHREIDDAANACARGLRGRGLVAGDAVAIMSANRAEFLIAFLGILRAGMAAVTINYKFPAALVDYVLADSASKYLFCDGPRRANFSAGPPVTDFDAGGAGGFEALLDPPSRLLPLPLPLPLTAFSSCVVVATNAEMSCLLIGSANSHSRNLRAGCLALEH